MSMHAVPKTLEQTPLEDGLFSLVETAIPIMNDSLAKEGYTAVFLLDIGRRTEKLDRIRPPYEVIVIISDKSGVTADRAQSRRLLSKVQEDGGDTVYSPLPDTNHEIFTGKRFLDLSPHVPIQLGVLRTMYTRYPPKIDILQERFRGRLEKLKEARLFNTSLCRDLLKTLENTVEAKRRA